MSTTWKGQARLTDAGRTPWWVAATLGLDAWRFGRRREWGVALRMRFQRSVRDPEEESTLALDWVYSPPKRAALTAAMRALLTRKAEVWPPKDNRLHVGAAALRAWLPDASDDLLAAVDWFEGEGGQVRALELPGWRRLVVVHGTRAAVWAMPQDLQRAIETDLIGRLVFAAPRPGGAYVHVGARGEFGWSKL